MLRPSVLHRISALPLSSITGRTTANFSRAFSSSPRNHVARLTIVGQLGNVPEREYTSTGKEVVRYVVGHNHGTRDNPKTSWFRLAHFGPTDSQAQYLTGLQKGSLVYVEAEPQSSTFVDERTAGPDGEPLKRSTWNFVHRTLRVLRKPGSGDSSASPEADAEAEARAEAEMA
ncbi:MAG: ssDNA-binding protein, mitochondrial [Bathelium mastoideum]|nr:MAG: ssDNA-binding protein, mitochondrial [Bathelium mastoideum]